MLSQKLNWLIVLLVGALAWMPTPKMRAAVTTTPTVYQNLGFIQGNIWYSKDPFEEGEVIRIYSAVFNSSPDDLLGTVRFYDNGIAIGDNDFSVVGGGRIQDVWVDWQVSAGDHTISAEIVNAKISVIGEKPKAITVGSQRTGGSERYVAPKPKPAPTPPPAKAIATTSPEKSLRDLGASTSTTTSGSGNGGLLPAVQGIMPNSVSNVVGQVAGAMDQMADRAADALEKEQQIVLARIAAVNTATDAPIDMGSLGTTTKSTAESGRAKNAPRGTLVTKGKSPSSKITLAYAWDRTYAALLGAAIYVLRTHWLMYLILFILVVLIIRWIFKKIKG